MPTPASTDPLIGRVVDDRYRINRIIGRGGMGVVYEAEATRLGKRLCAVKVLLPEFTRNETAVARFGREAQVAARVKHPNVVEIFDTGTTKDGLGYIAMELLVGESLDRTLQRDGVLPWPRAQRVILQICRALSAAHAQGIVHRDMKPENCFRCLREDDDDFIKVLDFGIAKLTDPANSEAGRLTATNSVIGTYAYMAYEQIRGEEIDHRVDVWATGVIMYQLLTGHLPFRGNNQGQIWRAITEYDPEPMRNLVPLAGIPEVLETIVRQAFARSLTDRYATIDAFGRALASVQADGSVRSLPTSKLATLGRAAPPTAMALGIAATMPVAGPGPSARTDIVRSDDLTELIEHAVDTDEVVTDAPVSPITTPDSHTVVAPARPETMQTALADVPAFNNFEGLDANPIRPRSRRTVLLLAGIGLPAVALAIALSQGTEDPATVDPETRIRTTTSTESLSRSELAAPSIDKAPDAVSEPDLSPAPPSSPKLSLAEPIPKRVADRKSTPTAAKVTKPSPKKPESFAVQAGKALQRLASSQQMNDCFTTYKTSDPMKVGVEISAATGDARVTVPPTKRGSGLALCIGREFQAWSFPTGSPADSDYVVGQFTLNSR